MEEKENKKKNLAMRWRGLISQNPSGVGRIRVGYTLFVLWLRR